MEFIFFALSGLLASFLLIDYLRRAGDDRTRERLMAEVTHQEEEEVSLWGDAADLLQLESIQKVLGESPLARHFDLHLRRSGLPLNLPRAFLVVVIITATAAGITYALSNMPIAAVAAGLLMPGLMWLILSKLAERRTRLLDKQLPAMVSQLITTLRSGGTPIQAMQAASRNAPSPVRESIADLLHSMQLGIPAIQAWRDWAVFWDTRSAHLLSMGVRLKWESGGQMTSILTHILESMEFHHRMQLRVQTITAQARLSAYILTGLPFAIAMMTYSIRPELFEHMINDPLGQKALLFTGGLLTTGFFWLRRMARLDH